VCARARACAHLCI